MAYEIEHKFLVSNTDYRSMAQKIIRIEQGYLSADPDRVVRIRITDEMAFLTVKGRNIEPDFAKLKCDFRHEFEYEIPVEDARQMIQMCKYKLQKTRYIVPFEGFIWEVDEFHGRHEGLTVAEIELDKPGETFSIPSFVGKEVTGDPKYYNSSLSKQLD